MYLLTPNGIEEKSSITLRFLKIKMQEYELLKAELSLLVQETKSVLTIDVTSDIEKTAISIESNQS